MNAKEKQRNEISKAIQYKTEKQVFKMYGAKCNAEKLKIALKLIEREKNKEVKTVREFIDNRLFHKIAPKLNSLASCLPDMGYSMGAKYIVQCLKFRGIYSNCEEYSKSSKYRATHGYFELKISLDEFKNSEDIGGIFTYIYPNQKRKVKKCWWYIATGQKNHYSIKKIHGYIFEGFHGETYEAAKKGGERNIQIKKAELIRKKQNEKQKEQSEKNYKKALRLQYSYSDSLKVNCEAGTKAFILRCGLDASKQYRGSFLVKVATEKSPLSLPFVKRMICSNC